MHSRSYMLGILLRVLKTLTAGPRHTQIPQVCKPQEPGRAGVMATRRVSGILRGPEKPLGSTLVELRPLRSQI